MTSLSGTVIRGSDGPARTATVELLNSAGDVIDQVACDDEGRFLYNVPPGSWRLFVWDPHGGRAKLNVHVVEDEDAEFLIDLTSHATRVQPGHR